jgi:hypothetical protein
MTKGAPSLNPRGRPRVGDSLADAMRRKFPPERIVDLAERLVETAESEQVRLAALQMIAERAHGKVPSDLNINASTTSDDEDRAARIAAMPLEQRKVALEKYREARRLMGAIALGTVIDVEAKEA